jgi:TolB-like protein
MHHREMNRADRSAAGSQHGRTAMIARSASLAVVLLCCVPALPAHLHAQATPDPRPAIAVFPFEGGFSLGAEERTLAALSVGVQQILITELAMNTQLRIVDRSIIRDILAEQDLGASGRVDAETAARIGRTVGARYAITGSFMEVEGAFRLVGRIVDVETSEILRADQVTDRRANLYGIIATFGNRLTDGVNLPVLPRALRDQQAERAKVIPDQAVVLFSLAQQSADRGDLDGARQLYLRITTEFPQYTNAREALRQLGGG